MESNIPGRGLHNVMPSLFVHRHTIERSEARPNPECCRCILLCNSMKNGWLKAFGIFNLNEQFVVIAYLFIFIIIVEKNSTG